MFLSGVDGILLIRGSVVGMGMIQQIWGWSDWFGGLSRWHFPCFCILHFAFFADKLTTERNGQRRIVLRSLRTLYRTVRSYLTLLTLRLG